MSDRDVLPDQSASAGLLGQLGAEAVRSDSLQAEVDRLRAENERLRAASAVIVGRCEAATRIIGRDDFRKILVFDVEWRRLKSALQSDEQGQPAESCPCTRLHCARCDALPSRDSDARKET